MADPTSFRELAKWMDADTLMNMMYSTCPSTASHHGGTIFGPRRQGPEVDKQVAFHMRFARDQLRRANGGTEKAPCGATKAPSGKDKPRSKVEVAAPEAKAAAKPVPKVEVKRGVITAIEGMRYQSYAGYNCSCGADHVLVDSTLDKREEVSCGACGARKIFERVGPAPQRFRRCVRHYCANGDEL